MKIVLYGSPVTGFRERLAGELSIEAEIAGVGYDADPRALAEAFDGAGAVVTVRYDARVPPCPGLRLVQVPGVGCDEIETVRLPPTASLCNVHGHEPGSAEYVVWALLEWRHRLCEAAAEFRAGSWARSSRAGAPPHGELAGSTALVVGLGPIGQAVARRLAAFDVTVLAANRTPRHDVPGVAECHGLEALPRLAGRADFVVLCIALAPETRGLIDASVLAAMRPDAVLVNVARGPVVDEAALHDALAGGRIGGAVIDVWYRYPDGAEDVPPSRFDFAALPNVMMTPHISGWTTGTVARRWRFIAENIERAASGAPLDNVVRPARGAEE
ncbi:MAG: 2-hydroxyacid dehydrogenase [Azospirillaceae bacterium]